MLLRGCASITSANVAAETAAAGATAVEIAAAAYTDATAATNGVTVASGVTNRGSPMGYVIGKS